MGIIEFIFGVVLQGVWEVVIIGIAKLIIRIGAVIFSIITLFKVTPKEHYETESIDKKFGLFWLGFFTLACISYGLYLLFWGI